MDRALPPPSRMRRALILGAVFAGFAATVGAGFMMNNSQRHYALDADRVIIATANKSLFLDVVPMRGRITPKDIVYLDAMEGGMVSRVLVQAGDTVVADQPLLEFGNTQLQLDVIEREARLIEQINNLRGIETSLEQARVENAKSLANIDYELVRLQREVDRYSQLVGKGGVVSREVLDKSQDQLTHYQQLRPLVAESNLKQDSIRARRLPEIAEALHKLREDLQVTRGKLDNLIVRAPAAGRLTTFNLKVGENCGRGQRLAEITLDNGFKVAADIDEYYLASVRVGQSAEVDYHARKLKLTITRVYPQVSAGRFIVDLSFDESAPSELVAGETIQGRLTVGSPRTSVIIPSGNYLSQTGGQWVFVVAPDGKTATRRDVQIGRRNAQQAEVVAGLEPGERVIVSDYAGFDQIERLDIG